MTSATGARRARIARGLGAAAAVLLLGTAGVGAWFYHRLDHNISTFSPDGVATSRPPEASPVPGGGRPVNVLVLGSDSRSGANGALAGGDAAVGNSDTAILFHIYGDHRHAVGVSLPRDTLVTIPPCKLPSGAWSKPRESAMLNSAFTVGLYPQGNPACTQNTVETLTGLRIDHTIVVDFQGFAAMTNAVHGVDVCVPNDVNAFGIHLTKGRQTLSGQQALDYVRARHGFGDGSDIGRMKRQQAFISSLIKKVQDQGFNPTTLVPLADAATKSLTVDADLGSPAKLMDFAQSMQNIKLADIKFVTMPWRYAGDRVAVVHPDADTLWNLLQQDRTIDTQSTGQPADSASPSPSASPSATVAAAPARLDVPVIVHNASGGSGLAGRAAAMLQAKGYQNVSVAADSPIRSTTLITYADGQQDAATQLAQNFPGATVQLAPGGDGLTVTLGQDAAASTGSPTALPTAVPTGITDNTRPADTDLCSNLSYG